MIQNTIRCDDCGEATFLSQGLNFVESRLAAENAGWKTDDRSNRDLCPGCVEAIARRREAKKQSAEDWQASPFPGDAALDDADA